MTVNTSDAVNMPDENSDSRFFAGQGDLKENIRDKIRDERVVEAVLFTMGRSVDLKQLAAALESTKEEALAAVKSLMERYATDASAMQIIELDGSYQMCTKPEYYNELIRVAKVPKRQVLTDSILETLSIIAYKQPVTKAEIENIRGVASDYAVNKLIEYGLVNEAGRLDLPGKPILFATTEEFLRRFAVDSAKNLPQLDTDREAQILHEVEEEVGFKFGFENLEDTEDNITGENDIFNESDGNDIS